MNKPIIDNSFTSQRSLQNTSCNWTGSADFGRLVPFHVEELIATEKVVTCRPRIEMQMLPIASPTFGKLDLYVHYFYVPTRLIWTAANDVFSRQGPNKNAVFPEFQLKLFVDWYNGLTPALQRGIFKHLTSLGWPDVFNSSVYGSSGTSPLKDRYISLLPLRAYQQIWWDFYRDPETLRDDTKPNYLDYTSGHLSSNSFNTPAVITTFSSRSRQIKDSWIANLFADQGLTPSLMPTGLLSQPADSTFPVNVATGFVDTENSNVQNVNTSQYLRTIEAVTRLSERLSLAGKRQIDAMYASYGVKPDFMKLNMCQYLGGAKQTVLVSDITSSADTSVLGSEQGAPLGAKAGSGYVSFDNLDISYTANEPGYLIGIFSVMPHVHFVQGMNRMWYRSKVEDFFTKSLERTGQIAIEKSEVGVKYSNNSVDVSQDENTFAFTQPYPEYKRGQDILAGDFLKYHNDNSADADGNVLPSLQYMHSMEMYVDYPSSRQYNANDTSMSELATQFNKIFYYQGGAIWEDVDDHFHLCIDKLVKKDSPADGYAVPTVETTEDPHEKPASIGADHVL